MKLQEVLVGQWKTSKLNKSASEIQKDVKKIKNTQSLDDWIKKNPITGVKKANKGVKSLMSRVDALRVLFGEKKADQIIRNLEVDSWDMKLSDAMLKVLGIPSK